MTQISVIIPTYNRAETILKTIDSVLMQEGCTFEIIIVDDCSSDNTKEIIKEQTNNQVFYYCLNINSGPQVARNYGAKKACSDLLVFLDSDDLLLADSLSQRINYFRFNPNCESAYSNYKVSFKTKNEDDYIKLVNHNQLSYPDVLKSLSVVPTSAFMIKKDTFDIINGFDVNLPSCQDDDIIIRCFSRNTCEYIPIYSCLIIHHPGERISGFENLSIGKTKLIDKFEGEILRVVGKTTLIQHFINNGIDYLFLNKIDMVKMMIFKVKKYGRIPYYYILKSIVSRTIIFLFKKIRFFIFRFR